MKNLLISVGVLSLISACGVDVAKAPDTARGPSVTGLVAAKAPQAQPQPTPTLKEKPAEKAASEKLAEKTVIETAISPLAPIECPEGTQYYFQDVTEGCLVELADGRLVPTHRWKQYYGSRDGLLNTYREYKNGLAHGTWKAWTATGMPKVVAQYRDSFLVKLQRHGEASAIVTSEFESLPGGALTKMKIGNGLSYARTGDSAIYQHKSDEHGWIAVAELKEGKFVFSQGSPSRILLKGFHRGELGRFAHASDLTSFFRQTQMFDYSPVLKADLKLSWQPYGGPDKTFDGYFDAGEMIQKHYTLPKNEQNEELFNFQGAGIADHFKKDPATSVIYSVLDYYRKTDEAFLSSKFPPLPFER